MKSNIKLAIEIISLSTTDERIELTCNRSIFWLINYTDNGMNVMYKGRNRKYFKQVDLAFKSIENDVVNELKTK